MAFTVTVIDREDPEITAGRSCDGCDAPSCDSCGSSAGGAQVDDTVTAQLSPLED